MRRDKLTLVYWPVRTELGVTGQVLPSDLSKVVQAEVCNVPHRFCYLSQSVHLKLSLGDHATHGHGKKNLSCVIKKKKKCVLNSGCSLPDSENVSPSESIFYFPAFDTEMDREIFYYYVISGPLCGSVGVPEILSKDP